MSRCPQCSQEFVNPEEVDQHVQMVHADKWEGRAATSQDGDENAVGAVSPMTADTLAVEAAGGKRPNAEERAYARQHGVSDESDKRQRATGASRDNEEDEGAGEKKPGRWER